MLFFIIAPPPSYVNFITLLQVDHSETRKETNSTKDKEKGLKRKEKEKALITNI